MPLPDRVSRKWRTLLFHAKFHVIHSIILPAGSDLKRPGAHRTSAAAGELPARARAPRVVARRLRDLSRCGPQTRSGGPASGLRLNPLKSHPVAGGAFSIRTRHSHGRRGEEKERSPEKPTRSHGDEAVWMQGPVH